MDVDTNLFIHQKNFLFKINEIKHANNKIDNQIARILKSISNDNSNQYL